MYFEGYKTNPEMNLRLIPSQVTLNTKKKRTNTTPHIYISGEIHGDEVVGPIMSVELLEYLARHYKDNAWVRRLVDTRVILVSPMTNALGFVSKQ